MIVISNHITGNPMLRTKTSLLLHPFFLFNLFLLIANDHWWKHEYANALTGKISDFAGVFVMAISLVACCRFKKIYAIQITAAFFTWWKSPLSESFITAFGLARVVDYSDLFALSILPAIFLIKPFNYGSMPVKYALPLATIITWTAMVATSLPYEVGGYRYPPGHILLGRQYRTQLNEEDFLRKLDSLRIPYKKDSLDYLPVNSNGLMMVVKDQDSIYKMTPVTDLKDTILYYEKHLGSHYVIPTLVLQEDTITNVRFRFHQKGKRKFVTLMEMIMPEKMAYKYLYNNKVQRKYREMLKTFMLE